MKMKCALILCFSISLILISFQHVLSAPTTEVRLPCLTEACIQESAHILKRMNNSIDPCDDFYEFSCGRYIKDAELPDDKSELDPLSVTTDLVFKQVKKIITEKSKPGEIQPFTLLKKFYAACKNTSAIELNSVNEIKSIFSSLGGFPILDEGNWTESNWVELTAKLRQHGYNTDHFIAIDSDINPKNSNEYIISIDQAANEEIAKDNLELGLQDRLVKSYANYLIDLVVLLGAEREFATKEVHDVIEFRAKIASYSVEKLEHVQLIINANESTIDTLIKDYPTIPWLELINGVLAFPNRKILGDAKVVLVPPKYITQFDKLIKETPKRVQVNHALLQVLRASIHFLPKTLRDREQKFLASATGVTKAPPRWDICTIYTTENFHLATDALYVRKYVDEQTRRDVTEMVTDIKDAFVKILNEVDWMDKETKGKAIEKAEQIKPHIAYATELLDDKQLEEYYAELKFDSDNILTLVSVVSKFKRDKALRFYGGPVVKIHWTTRLAAITSNAIYDPQTNSIQIPSGIMQNELYNKDRPKYMNYGALGMIIGHEITHGFDDTGKAFDKNGNAADWWEASTLDAYSTKAKCFIKQYGNYTVPEISKKLNGENTLSENIADNGGVKEAYLAYLEWVKRNQEELPIPGLNYTARQLFWISLGNAWCAKIRPSALEQAVLADGHSPNKYRILGGLGNVRYFSEDFNCPVGSNMNPSTKCQVW